MWENRFFILSAPKSWTTSLYHYLQLHPEICMSSVKEPHFFSKDIIRESLSAEYKRNTWVDLWWYFSHTVLPNIHAAHISNTKHYERLFEHRKENQIFWEASTSYLFSKIASSEIYKKYPDAKFLVILRNPISRAYSHRAMAYRDWKTTKRMIESIQNDMTKEVRWRWQSHLYIEPWFYSSQLKRYFDLFPRSNFKIIFAEDLFKDKLTILNDISDFLWIKRTQLNDDKVYNSWWIPKYPFFNWIINKLWIMPYLRKLLTWEQIEKIKWFFNKKTSLINEEEIKFLNNIYKDEIQKLEKLLNINLNTRQ